MLNLTQSEEDADEVAKAKQQMDEYAAKMKELTKKSEEQEAKVKYLDENAVEFLVEDDPANLLN